MLNVNEYVQIVDSRETVQILNQVDIIRYKDGATEINIDWRKLADNLNLPDNLEFMQTWSNEREVTLFYADPMQPY